MVAGDNAATLATIKAAHEARSGALQSRRPADNLEGKILPVSLNGDAAAVAFNVAHGLTNDAGNGVTPASANFAPSNAVSGAIHWITRTTANVVITYAVAPATGTGNVQGSIQVFR